MKATIKSKLPASQDTVWKLLQRSDTLVFVTKKWVTFAQATTFPKKWKVDVPVDTEVLMFGRPPGSPYTFTFECINNDTYIMRTRESGGMVKEWIHTMRVVPVSDGTCWYIDEVEVHAGVMTPLLWLYVKLYYRYRHKRWLELLQSV